MLSVLKLSKYFTNYNALNIKLFGLEIKVKIAIPLSNEIILDNN